MKNVVLGVAGSIAAFKAAEIAGLLVKKGYGVQVVMTAAAAEFITPLTMQSVSRHPVCMDMFNTSPRWEIEHISLAQGADLVLVAPATADLIGLVAAGTAGNLLTATIMATRAPVIFAPAMNTGMYENPVFQHRMGFLKRMGYIFIEPDEGRLACGASGKGRLPDPEKIVAFVDGIFTRRHDLQGRHVLVTAGPTREPLDPVRFLSNYSSGKMGYALAREAAARGAQVTLISGPSSLAPPEGVEAIAVETAREMFDAVKALFPAVDIVIKAAAVADFRPCRPAKEKIKKDGAGLFLELERTEDILGYLGEQKGKQILVGFAAETREAVKNAQKKLARKNLDLIVVNDLTEEGAGFEVDTNVATLLFRDGNVLKLNKMTKDELAGVILDEIVKLLSKLRRR
jgi:phosphopantothenoylcysteine decarboxylase/phosphopantothenate--cysteine ligase